MVSNQEKMLLGKHFVVGITGSIAAYKTCHLIRLLIKSGAEVQVVITPSGKEFITPLTLSTLSCHPVISDFFSNRDGSWNSHVDLGLWADAMIIAPATASTIGKMANGIADNMLLTTYLSMKAPVFIAPAMDLDMFKHPTTQKNLETLKSFGNYIIEPTEGELASKLIGKGRMEEPEYIYNKILHFFDSTHYKKLKDKNILITAGPTFEAIDPVRYIGNHSSGKMGFALAEYCAEQGANVTLITGPVHLNTIHPKISKINIISAKEMYNKAMEYFPKSDITILCAAVADFTVKPSSTKIKRKDQNLNLSLHPTQDIAASLGLEKKANQILIGFALETNNEKTNAQKKLKEKHLDFIVLNSLNDKDAGFKYDTNKISILSKTREIEYPLKTKKEVAKDIIEFLCQDFL